MERRRVQIGVLILAPVLATGCTTVSTPNVALVPPPVEQPRGMFPLGAGDALGQAVFARYLEIERGRPEVRYPRTNPGATPTLACACWRLAPCCFQQDV